MNKSLTDVIILNTKPCFPKAFRYYPAKMRPSGFVKKKARSHKERALYVYKLCL